MESVTPRKFAIPIPGPGRDALWALPGDMLSAGLEYFQIKDVEKKPYTVSGLALHLGMGYQSFLRYQANPAFSEVVGQLKAVILNQGETALFDKDMANGAKFHLSVLGMNEKTIVETHNLNVNANADVNLEALSDEDITRLIELRAKLALPKLPGSGTPAPEAEQNQNPVPAIGAASEGTLSETP